MWCTIRLYTRVIFVLYINTLAFLILNENAEHAQQMMNWKILLSGLEQA